MKSSIVDESESLLLPSNTLLMESSIMVESSIRAFSSKDMESEIVA